MTKSNVTNLLASVNPDGVPVYEFEGHRLTVLMRGGKPHFLVAEIGRALGYEDGARLSRKITGEWAGEFIASVDFVKLTGGDLAAVKSVIHDTPESGGSKQGGAQSMLLLTRDGLNLALMKTRKPAGIRMRRWLASEVLPALQTGEALALADSATLAKAIRAEMSRQLRTPEAKSAELSRLADNCARTLARGDSALMPAIRQWSIELAKGVVGFGGAGRELGYCSTSQFHSMRSLLKGLPNLVSIIPKTKRRAAVKALLGGSKQDVLPFMLEFDAAGIHVEVRATKSEAA